MRPIDLVPILRDGSVADPALDLAAVPADVLPATVTLYAARGFVPPWTAYLAVEGGRAVGTCAFPAAPRGARVEIAYFTFPAAQGRGVATAMARRLVALARAADPALAVLAYTLPERGASTAILSKLGFACSGLVDHPEDGWVWEWLLAPAPGGLPERAPPR
jgi:ribosomal-protein-alanine N-acetyltransferase